MEDQTSTKTLELTARNIYDQLIEGKKVSLLLHFDEATFLFNHINVIKSREKRFREDLGIDVERRILRMDNKSNSTERTFYFVDPLPYKKYKVWSIIDTGNPT